MGDRLASMSDWLTMAIAFLSLAVAVGTRVSRPARLTRSLENLRCLLEIRREAARAVDERQVQLAMDEVRLNLRRYQTRYGRWEVGIPYALGIGAYLTSFLLMAGDKNESIVWWVLMGSLGVGALTMVATIVVIRVLQARSRRDAGPVASCSKKCELDDHQPNGVGSKKVTESPHADS